MFDYDKKIMNQKVWGEGDIEEVERGGRNNINTVPIYKIFKKKFVVTFVSVINLSSE